MRKRDVAIHGLYYANVSSRRVTVRIDHENPYGGWDATNKVTGRTIRIRSAARLTEIMPVPKAAMRIVSLTDSERLQQQIVAFMLLERARQDTLKAEGRFRYVLSDPDCPNDIRLACLLEELAEVGKAVMGDAVQDARDLEKELMQLGALTIAWLEYVVTERGDNG